MMIIRLVALVFMLIVGVMALRQFADFFGAMGKNTIDPEVLRYASVLEEPGSPPASLRSGATSTASVAPLTSRTSASPTPPVVVASPATPPALSVQAARDCLAGPTPEAHCLRALSKHDRAAASTAATGLVDRPSSLGLVARSLVAYPDRAALVAALADSGCAPPARPGDALTLLDLLETSTCAHALDPKTSRFPNRHDQLLVTLAGLGARELTSPPEVLFEESPPPNDGAPYALRAYANGRRFTAQAQNFDAWYDVDAAVGLLNEVARRLGKTQRWVVARADGDDVLIVAARGPWLQGVVSRGLMPLESGSERIAEAVGHEQVNIERLP